MCRLFMIAVVFITCATAMPVRSAPVDRATVADALVLQGDALARAYTPGRAAEAADAWSSLYFDDFEGSGLEADIGASDPNLKTELEARFSRLIAVAIRAGPAAELESAWQFLRTGLTEVAAGARARTKSGLGDAVQALVSRSGLLAGMATLGVGAALVVLIVVPRLRPAGVPLPRRRLSGMAASGANAPKTNAPETNADEKSRSRQADNADHDR